MNRQYVLCVAQKKDLRLVHQPPYINYSQRCFRREPTPFMYIGVRALSAGYFQIISSLSGFFIVPFLRQGQSEGAFSWTGSFPINNFSFACKAEKLDVISIWICCHDPVCVIWNYSMLLYLQKRKQVCLIIIRNSEYHFVHL